MPINPQALRALLARKQQLQNQNGAASIWGDSQFQFQPPPQLRPEPPPVQDVNQYGIPPTNENGIPIQGIQNMYRAMGVEPPPKESMHVYGGATPPGNSAQQLSNDILTQERALPPLPAIQDNSDIEVLPKAVREPPAPGFLDNLRSFLGSSQDPEERRLENFRDITEGLGKLNTPTASEIRLGLPPPTQDKAVDIREKLQRLRNRRAFKAAGLPEGLGDASPGALPAIAGIEKSNAYGDIRNRDQKFRLARDFNTYTKNLNDVEQSVPQAISLLEANDAASTKMAMAKIAKAIGLAPVSDQDRIYIGEPFGIVGRIENSLNRWLSDDLSPAYKAQAAEALRRIAIVAKRTKEKLGGEWAQQKGKPLGMEPEEMKAFLLNSADASAMPAQQGESEMVTVFDDTGIPHKVHKANVQILLQQGASLGPPKR